MRLLDTETGQFVEKDPENTRYAILSHTWDKKEQTYEELKRIQERYKGTSSHGEASSSSDDESSTSTDSGTSAPSERPRDGPPPKQAPSQHPSDSPTEPTAGAPPTTCGRLTQSEIDSLFRAFVEKYGLENPQQSVPSTGGASTEKRTTSGPSPASLLSEQLPSSGPSVTAPLIPRSTRFKSGYTRGMVELQTGIPIRSSRNAPHSRAGSPSTSTSSWTNRRSQASLDHGQGTHSPTPPTSKLLDDSESSEVASRSPAAIGRLSASEVEGLFRTFAATYNLTSLTLAATQSGPSVILKEQDQSLLPNDPLSETPRPLTDIQHLTQSEVAALRAFIATYGLAGPPCPPALKSIWNDPELSPKIRDACRVARENGFRYIWIDSCCIDKSSSSELSEAINSMYKWYSLAVVCYAYLGDVPPGKSKDHHAEDSAFRKSRWFTRGWTLQELIAPESVEFLSQDWAPIGSKLNLVGLVEEVTNIDGMALLHLEPLHVFSVAQRLSWAAKRETTRVEDRAYSLLGIFDINMPTLYGEGDRAFRRLQEQILQRFPDHSLFAWRDIYLGPENMHHSANSESLHFKGLKYRDEYRDFFATSPTHFNNGYSIQSLPRNSIQLLSIQPLEIEYTSTPYGLRTELQIIPLTLDVLQHAVPHKVTQLYLNTAEGCQWYLAILYCEHGKHPGHPLGRVCYTTTSEDNDKAFIYPGALEPLNEPNLFPLSSETIQYFHKQIETKTVYIPHPNRATHAASSSNREQPYTAIKLVLVRKTRDSLRSRGYLAGLRNPNPDHPTTHWLTLSNDKHTITVEFQHTLDDDGKWFIIEAKVKMSGSHVQFNSALNSEQADGHTVSWWDSTPWKIQHHHKRVELDAAEARTLTVQLGLNFLGHGYYHLRVDVLGEELVASSAAGLAGGPWRRRREE